MPKKDGVKSTSKGRGLTDKQKRFVEEYLIDLNATQAAIRAGYSKNRASELGYQLLQKTTVQQAIEAAQNKRAERVQITQDDVIRMLLENIEVASGKKAVIKTEIRKSEDGELVGDDIAQFVYESSSVNKALELLGKHLGMFSQKVDLTSSDGSMALGSLRDLFSDDAKAD
ncbi:terminase small subunit [Avibacterium paragallinarum]|uniref:Terminase small subunit n=1 Tax=Avibacterium paragallinarum TaxID=728 RepID=A0A380X2R7_AVIPA|nr:terminase small subunit [Avibacterium paragallinarum]QJE10269.1 terminase small subunit [Avibacterium paragallinarum]QJE12463.1 terminase small subunit [Avibacterium paragallinarum]QJE14666.1 terminase small subunit [Avibacterium paragallinarum]QJE16863.1 terminase small subunit [Avibacterium paragallinarum]QJE19059.1 terminase small subunit [Avibacterium paragallinarum]